MNRVVNEKVPVDKAVDEMIARIKAGRGLNAAIARSGDGCAARRCRDASPCRRGDGSRNMSTLALPDAPSRCFRPVRRSKRLSPWQTWGLILLAPYVARVPGVRALPGRLRPVARAPSGELRQALRRSDLRAVGPQHAGLPDRRHQPQDGRRAVPVRILRAGAHVDQVAVAAVHPAVGGAVDPDDPVDPLHAESGVGHHQSADLPASPAPTARTGSTIRRSRCRWRCSCTSGSRCRSGR